MGGIIEGGIALATALGSGAGAAVGSELVGTAITTGLEGAAVGAGIGGVEAGLTGGNVLKGIEGGAAGGAITGGLGSALGGGLGADIGAGALGGVTNAAITGGNLGTGAALGGVAGGVMNALSPGGIASSTPATGTGGLSAASNTGLGAASGQPVDLTATPAAGGTFDVSSTPANANPVYQTGGGNMIFGAASPADVPAGSNVVSAPAATGSSLRSWLGGAPTGSGADTFNALNTAGVTGAAPGTGGVAGAKAPSSLSTLMSGISGGAPIGTDLANAGNVLASNPALALGTLGLGYSAIKGNQSVAGENQLKSEAAQLAAQGTQLQNALNGALPPGAQAAISQASNSEKAAIRSQYASAGLSGTMEADALAQVDQQVAAQGFKVAEQLYAQGISESSRSAELFKQIMSTTAQQNSALSGAVANFAGALAGGSGKTTG